MWLGMIYWKLIALHCETFKGNDSNRITIQELFPAEPSKVFEIFIQVFYIIQIGIKVN